MKLLRYGARAKEKPGLIDKDGRIRDLSGVIADITGETISPKGLARLG
jgi:2,4-diketo-3-deoxy-L-fuconate hydrolase